MHHHSAHLAHMLATANARYVRLVDGMYDREPSPATAADRTSERNTTTTTDAPSL